ncbi:MAG TPA: ATP-dependent helicase, partial [Mycobacteriales bacterium]|nr:ATP-dependent helicase [Mycobacteriales bacterium]
MPVRYLLRRDAPRSTAPLQLDQDQERVAAHAGGPLLVLAGPGTGKTATLVEAVARRVEAGAAPDSLLLLTFSRRAAGELRERLALRLAGRGTAPAAWTFHSFCLALLTEERARSAPGDPRPRLLSGPDQEAVIRELLRGDLADGRAWPPPLGAVLDTRGLADEVRALVARAQLLGLSPAEFADVAGDRADWQAVARFYEQYLVNLESQSLLDYAELVARAASTAHRPDVRERLRARFAAVWVDEYQDTDPAQESLLRALAGNGRDVTVVGDPDQAIYAFRGASVAGISRFPDAFRTVSGAPAPVAALRTCRRAGPELVAASRLVAARLPAGHGGAHRDLVPAGQSGSLQVVTLPTEAAEAEWIADRLRRAHLDDGMDWSRMAVLVRSGVASIPLLRRVFGSMGVPVEVARDEIPLSAEPALTPLLSVLRCVADPSQLTVERVRELLLSPLIGADPAELRRLGRTLRALARQRDPVLPPPGSAQLLHDAVIAPAVLADAPPGDSAATLRLVSLLEGARRVLDAGGTPADVLWFVWDSSLWRHRLLELSGGLSRDARAADRDLDAVVALFDAVERTQQQRVGIGVRALLETIAAQQIPAGSQDEAGLTRPGVRLLTAHRSKGLEWDLVVVAHVQEGAWPDLRARGSLLDPEELGPQGAQPPADLRAVLADERRLFYVGCTRARRELVVTAVAGVDEDAERPSRFLDELGVRPVAVTGRVSRPRTLAGLVAALRCEAVDP